MATPLHDNQRPSASVVYVTPEMARRWLGLNTVNRNVRSSRVKQYARDMAGGKWQLTGEAIKFSKFGSLVDGQHRLHAVIESDSTVPLFVVRGVDNEAQIVLDSGSARTSADNLHMAGFKKASLVAAIARRRISMINRGNVDYDNVSHTEIFEFVQDNPEISEAADIARRYASSCDIIPSTAGLAAWLIADTFDWLAADEFFCAAAEKVGLAPGDPVLAMTNFFAEQRRNRRKLSIEAQLSVIIRSFNYRLAGKSLKLIRVNSPAGGTVPIPNVGE